MNKKVCLVTGGFDPLHRGHVEYFKSAKNIADYLITNFHAPRSTLISIVHAIYGDNWKNLYSYALKKELKFLSFGDAVLFKITNK